MINFICPPAQLDGKDFIASDCNLTRIIFGLNRDASVTVAILNLFIALPLLRMIIILNMGGLPLIYKRGSLKSIRDRRI